VYKRFNLSLLSKILYQINLFYNQFFVNRNVKAYSCLIKYKKVNLAPLFSLLWRSVNIVKGKIEMDAKTAIFPIVLQRILKNAFANQSREFLIVYPSILRLNVVFYHDYHVRFNNAENIFHNLLLFHGLGFFFYDEDLCFYPLDENVYKSFFA